MLLFIHVSRLLLTKLQLVSTSDLLFRCKAVSYKLPHSGVIKAMLQFISLASFHSPATHRPWKLGTLWKQSLKPGSP